MQLSGAASAHLHHSEPFPSLSILQLPCAAVHAASASRAHQHHLGHPLAAPPFFSERTRASPEPGPSPSWVSLALDSSVGGGDAEGEEHTYERFRRVQKELQHGDEMGLLPGRHRATKPFPPWAQKRPRCEPQSPAPCLPPLGFPWMKAPQSTPSFVCGKRSPP